MYEKFYDFTGMPFQLTPDSRFFYGSKGHSRAIAHLIYGLSQGEGFIIVTGEVGAGKTTLVERLWSELDRETYTLARINTTQVSGEDLFRLTMNAFGINSAGLDKATLLRDFEDMLRAYAAGGRRCLLVVDEAQNLSLQALEELRMLSNVSVEGHASLQTILLGQPQFRRKLASPDLDQLRQRVLASYHLGPLSDEETRAYIEYRLNAVGWHGNPAWTDGAFTAVYRYTGGIPRRINRLCSRVLLYGALEESTTITGPMVDNTANELQHDLEGLPAAQARAPGDDLASQIGAAIGASASDGDERGHSYADLAHRVQVLEETVARRERVFQRLIDVFSGFNATRR
ncbi:XrtA/PEP-CTERM system-associated ATPase [Limobrevibacterium gyesilva]|uniref:XrtA-associated ATPase n=1 Tax=Limobrevibacterium gyesilva TaxID=2991712 RepID=A0AA41YUQ0_9PROT|nr:XrtA/PEP-CTERM system-associated ATPase [Limobrevibacterium gyesilva]MCW3476918.1 XrtA-associated ATPase [Limobrevibacterium gyesilva]